MRLRYAQTASTEIDDLLTYLAERSPGAAARLGAIIRRAETTLVAHPHLGAQTSASPTTVRRLVQRPYPYVLFYEVAGDQISVIGIRHAARDPTSMPGAS